MEKKKKKKDRHCHIDSFYEVNNYAGVNLTCRLQNLEEVESLSLQTLYFLLLRYLL